MVNAGNTAAGPAVTNTGGSGNAEGQGAEQKPHVLGTHHVIHERVPRPLPVRHLMQIDCKLVQRCLHFPEFAAKLIRAVPAVQASLIEGTMPFPGERPDHRVEHTGHLVGETSAIRILLDGPARVGKPSRSAAENRRQQPRSLRSAARK